MPSGGTSREALQDLKDHFQSLCSTVGTFDPAQIAVRTAGGVMPDTVMKMLAGPGLPAWGYWQQVTEALGGDVQMTEKLWLAAQQEHGSFELGQTGSDDATAGEGSVVLPSDPTTLQALGQQLRDLADAKREHHDEILRGMRSVEGNFDRVSALIEDLRSKADQDRLAQRINELKSERRRLRQEINRLKGELVAVKTELARIQTDRAEVNSRLREFEYERAGYEERLRHRTELELRDAQEQLRKLDESWSVRVKGLTDELSATQKKAARDADELRRSLSEANRDRTNFQQANQQLQAKNKEHVASLNAALKQIERVYRRWWLRLLLPPRTSGPSSTLRP